MQCETMTTLQAARRLEEEVNRRRSDGQKVFVLAVDGRCGSGKTTLAAELSRQTNWPVVHMDDFYLQPFQRTQERYQTPGENVDHERFRTEVLEELKQKGCAEVRAYRFHEQRFLEPYRVEGPVVIVEGSYSMNRHLRDLYDFSVFLDIDPERQKERILERNGSEKLKEFVSRWIPLEELYFSSCGVQEACSLILSLEDGR